MSKCEIVEEDPMRQAESYQISGEVSVGEKGVTLYRAKYVNSHPPGFSGKPVAIKVFKRQRLLQDVFRLTRDIEHSRMSDHKNITKVHCTFVHGGDLWAVMPDAHVASVGRVVARRFKRGMPEREAGLLLREVLEGLSYLHGRQWMHKALDLEYVFVDKDGGLRIDFDLLAYDPEGIKDDAEEAEGAWPAPAPEILSDDGFGFESDVWGFGIAALKLVLGHVPARSYKELAAFLVAWPEKEAEKTRKEKKQTCLVRGFGCFYGGVAVKEDAEEKVIKVSAAFMKMVKACLAPEPSKRPSAKELMEFDFFEKLQGDGTPFFKSLAS